MPKHLFRRTECMREMTNLYRGLVLRLERKSAVEGLDLMVV
jgi:hypothetical protein